MIAEPVLAEARWRALADSILSGGSMKKTLAAVIASSFCVTAQAAETYVVDTNHTHATFAFQHLGFSTFHGKIPAQGGTVTLDPAQKTGTIEVVFDVKGIVTGVPKFDDHLRGKDFFLVEQHPTATFRSNRITFDGDAPAGVAGELTIKGITKPVTLDVTSFKCAPHPMMKVPACGANATAKIKRSDYGMTYAMPAVPDEIELVVEIEATAKK
jgi:polyisoprenoid-binding protein YceI